MREFLLGLQFASSNPYRFINVHTHDIFPPMKSQDCLVKPIWYGIVTNQTRVSREKHCPLTWMNLIPVHAVHSLNINGQRLRKESLTDWHYLSTLSN